MNGGFPRAYFSFGEPLAATYAGADWRRLYAALTVSCLLHAALFLVPYLGASTNPLQPAARSAQKPAAARALDVRLQRTGREAPPSTSNRARGSDLLPIAAPTYYRTEELTKAPRPTSEPKLDVPKSVARSVSGKVVLNLWINELGNVVSAEVESSDLPETVSGAVAAALGKVRFVPGEINGARVRTLMTIEVAYVHGRRPRP
jgi:TonB family protein